MEIIEISFGAKDSELQEWTYTIPKGMKAEIRDGKAIIKKKESEDERIRKAIIESLPKYGYLPQTSIKVEDAIAWLEKQKEQKDFQAKVKQRMEYLWDKLPDANRVNKGNCTPEEWKTLGAYMELEMNFDNGSEEKQKEQKPVEPIEFSNEFENQVSHLLASVLNGEHEYNEGFVKYVAQSLLGYAKEEQKSAEWSEEDEAMRDNILRVLSCFFGTSECESNPSLSTLYPAYQKEIDWLKSLYPRKRAEGNY